MPKFAIYLATFGSELLNTHQGMIMLHYAVVFFIIAIVAAIFGFGGIAAGAASIAQTLFFIFLVIALITFLMHIFQGKKS